MSVLELKGDILQTLSLIENEVRLKKIRDYILSYAQEESNSSGEDFWDNYSPEQKAELQKSFEESYDPTNDISHDDMKKKHAKWLNV